MEFRAKSPARVLGELAAQARRYRSFRFDAVDNILDTGLPERAAAGARPTAGPDYEIFYEVKANLTRGPAEAASPRAGVTQLQPGMESLSSRGAAR